MDRPVQFLRARAMHFDLEHAKNPMDIAAELIEQLIDLAKVQQDMIDELRDRIAALEQRLNQEAA